MVEYPEPVVTGLSFRGVQDEEDFPVLLEIVKSSWETDHMEQAPTLEGIAESYTESATFNPKTDAFLAFSPQMEPIGISRVGWYSSSKDTHLFYQISNLKREWRGKPGVWEAMVLRNDQRLQEIAAEHPAPHCYLQAWASDNTQDWIKVLGNTAYKEVRHFNNMLHDLKEIPVLPLPAGFEMREVKPEMMHAVWEAQKEMNSGLFENVEENWLEERYTDWLNDPSHTPHLWVTAWDGDTLAGMVLPRIDDEENKTKNRKHGYTEHVYVRPVYRKRGLSSALVAMSLQVLKDHGMEESELGVDAENDCGAFRVYEKLGFKTFRVDTWYRKPINS